MSSTHALDFFEKTELLSFSLFFPIFFDGVVGCIQSCYKHNISLRCQKRLGFLCIALAYDRF